MSSFDIMLPISYLRQMFFCPRIPWYKYVMNLEPPEQGWVSQGHSWHNKQQVLQLRRIPKYSDMPQERNFEVYVEHKDLRIYGYVDEVQLWPDKLLVVEYKSDTKSPTAAQVIQLCAYGVSAQEHYQRDCIHGVLIKGKAHKQYLINIDKSAIDTLRQKILILRQLISLDHLPDSSAQAQQCGQCEYLRFCNDR